MPHSENYIQCTSSSCGINSQSLIRSNISLVSAWDPVSENTIFAYVDTTRNSLANNGKIKISPGFFDSSSNRLKISTTLETNNQTLPAIDIINNPNNLQYGLRTDTPVGLACHSNINSFTFNFLLAWNERTTGEGVVLYTYFKVNGSSIHWLGTMYRMSTTELLTVSGVSAAYFNGNFWLAVKTLLGDIKYTYAYNHYTDWSGHSTSIGSFNKVLDPPTWLYHRFNNSESALIWTVH